MRHIALCVCTYNRPDGLRALLAAIDKQRFERISDHEVELVVIDNSRDGSANQICADHKQHGRFKAAFVHEPRKGLTNARNAALSAAGRIGASLIAFIDDDEVPIPTWLETLVLTLECTNAAAAVGPVYPIFEAPPPKWLPSDAYAVVARSGGTFVPEGHTGNAIIRMFAITKHGLSFDQRFSNTGGEDTIFFRTLMNCGGKIAMASQAIAYEIVPSYRMSPSWLFRRWYRTGMIEAHLGRYDPATLNGKLVNCARGMARLAGGSGRIVAAALLSPWQAPGTFIASFYTACRGAGLIANSFGRDYQEYAASRYR